MALIYQAELFPSKLGLIGGWAPQQPWFLKNPNTELTNEGAFRLSDPLGEVGIEILFVGVGGGAVLQIPVTYRNAPIVGGERWLIGTMDHSVLGVRYTYDALGDPAYIQALALAAFSGATDDQQYLATDAGEVPRDSTARAFGTGNGSAALPPLAPIESVSNHAEPGVTIIQTPGLIIVVPRVFLRGMDNSGDAELPVTDAPQTLAKLEGTWIGQDVRRTIAFAQLLDPAA